MLESSLYQRTALGRDVFDINRLHHELDSIDWQSPVIRETCEDLMYWVKHICFAAGVMLLMIFMAALIPSFI